MNTQNLFFKIDTNLKYACGPNEKTIARLHDYIRNEAKIHAMTDGEPLEQTLCFEYGRLDRLETEPLTAAELLKFCAFFDITSDEPIIACKEY